MNIKTILVLALLPIPAFAVNKTVKAAGGGDFTTIQACATAMAAGDSCTVFAGTYSESPSVPAGTVGNYKTITVNGSDVVNVTAFTLASHTKLIGNCPVPASMGSCGFSIGTTGGTGTGSHCVTFGGGTTDIYVRATTMQSCGNQAMIAVTSNGSVTFAYIQGNTMAYACIGVAQAGTATKECDGILLEGGNHVLIEQNDFSHYSLGIDQTISNVIARNNTFHDQFETEAAGNAHTDTWFSEPGISTAVEFNVYEGNLQRNAVGPNAKGILDQNDTGNVCGSLCDHLIDRFNIVSRIGGARSDNTSGSDWPFIKAYNNTEVDTNEEIDLSTSGGGIIDNALNSTHATFLNNLYYLTGPQNGGVSSINMYACGANCTSGFSDYWCVVGCNHVNGHTYGTGSWANDAGNINSNPLFVSYVSAGNASNNYHLQSGSPARNAGTSLTTVNGTIASSTALVVTDAAYFQDGYGLSNAFSTVSPDCVSVTTVGNHVCITAVNYTTNTLTLASPISATNGDAVWLYSKSDGVQVLTGTAPDMGALPFSSVVVNPAPALVGVE